MGKKEKKPKAKASKASKEKVENAEKVEKVKGSKENKKKEETKEGKVKATKSKSPKEKNVEAKKNPSKVKIKDDQKKEGKVKKSKEKAEKAKSKSKEDVKGKELKKKRSKGKGRKKKDKNNNDKSKSKSKNKSKSTNSETMALSLEMQLLPEHGEEEETDNGMKREWESDVVRKMKLIENGFSYCLVLVMEDSTDTTKYGEYLLKAVGTGVRKNFVGISGSEISERVKRFMAEMESEMEYEEEDTYTVDQFQQLQKDLPGDSVTYDENGEECDCDEEDEEIMGPPNSKRDIDESSNFCTCTCDVEHDMTDVKPIGEYPVSCVDVDNAFQDIQQIVGDDFSCDEEIDEVFNVEQQQLSDGLTWQGDVEMPGEGIDESFPPPLTHYENDEIEIEIEELLGEDPHSLMKSYYGEGNAEDEVEQQVEVEVEQQMEVEEEEVYPSAEKMTEGNAEEEKVEVDYVFAYDDNMDRADLFAEAVKDTLGRIKKEDGSVKSLELSGVRSKDLIKTVNYPMMVPTQENEIQESPYPPPPTPSPFGKASVMVHNDTSRVDVRPSVVGGEEKKRSSQQGESGKSNAEQNENKDEDGNLVEKVPVTPKALDARFEFERNKNETIGIKTRMRKRGEILVPEYLRYKDDSPAKGPRKYVFLQGFYNPRIIDELRKIGVVVDAVLLISGEKPEKCPQGGSNGNTAVFQFWKRLMEMYHTPPYDKRHITILHYSLPESSTVQLDTTESLLPYIFTVYDEVAARVYEMIRQQQLCCCKH